MDEGPTFCYEMEALYPDFTCLPVIEECFMMDIPSLGCETKYKSKSECQCKGGSVGMLEVKLCCMCYESDCRCGYYTLYTKITAVKNWYAAKLIVDTYIEGKMKMKWNEWTAVLKMEAIYNYCIDCRNEYFEKLNMMESHEKQHQHCQSSMTFLRSDVKSEVENNKNNKNNKNNDKNNNKKKYDKKNNVLSKVKKPRQKRIAKNIKE